MSAIAYCALATANPYPGVMITFFEDVSISTAPSALISV